MKEAYRMDPVIFEEAMSQCDWIKRDIINLLTKQEKDDVRMGGMDFELYEDYHLDHAN